MTVYRYTREAGRVVRSPVTAETVTPPKHGEVIAFSGKRGKKKKGEKAAFPLGIDGKPIRTLRVLKGKRAG